MSYLRSTIDSGADAGAKDPAYAKRLASLKGKAEDFTKTLSAQSCQRHSRGRRARRCALR